MNLIITNRLNMINACITVANSTDYVNVWRGQAPADFAMDIAKLTADYGTTTAKAALIAGVKGGASDAKAAAETALENGAYILARALVNHFTKTSDLDSLGKVNIAKRDLDKLRNQDLIAKTTEIRDLANTAQSQPNAADRGVTPARIATLTAAISNFSCQLSNPRGQTVNRSTLLKELETDTADLMDQLHNLDDLVIQFDGTDAGLRFVEAWKRARIIVDNGHGHSNSDPSPTPPATPKPAT